MDDQIWMTKPSKYGRLNHPIDQFTIHVELNSDNFVHFAKSSKNQ